MTLATDTLVLMPCSATKKPHKAPAIEFYDGPLWQTLRLHRGAISTSAIMVLSGKFGFRSIPWLELSPYEAKLSPQRADYLIRKGIHGRNDLFGQIKPGRATGCSPYIEAGATDRVPERPYRAVISAGSGHYARVFDAFLTAFQAEGLVAKDAMIRRTLGGIGEQRGQLGDYLREVNAGA